MRQVREQIPSYGQWHAIRIAVLGLLAWAMVSAVSGCERPIQPEGPTAGELGDVSDVDRLWDKTLSVLRQFDFQPDRRDRAAGLITTFPTTSMQWHEPWRKDVADTYSLAHASLHTTQRKVTVRFVRADRPAIQVQVDVYRLSRPETQITTASSTLHGFTGSLPTTEGRAGGAEGSANRWVPLGRDAKMENRLLRRILQVNSTYVSSGG